MKKTKSVIAIFLTIILCFCLCSCSFSEPKVAEDAGFLVRFLNTGNSDCIIIRMDDINILIDAADQDDSDYILESLEELGVDKIDHFIITHYDNDHVGSAARVIYKVNTLNVYGPNYERDSKRTRNMKEAAKTHSSGLQMLTENYSFSTENGTVTIYPPQEEYYGEENDYSMIVTITYGTRSFLFAGDAKDERMSEFNLESTEEFDLVKTPHHGAFDTEFNDFLNYASPRYLVTCTDEYASVDTTLFNKARNLGARLLMSYDGEITAVCDGTNINISQSRS